MVEKGGITMEQLTAWINGLVQQLELPYLDIQVFQEYAPRYRYLTDPKAENAFLQMYSMSKAATVVAAMGLVESGKLSLTDRIEKFFPAFRDTVYRSGEEILPNPVPMTVKHLLTMTSGMSYDVRTPQILAVTKEKGQQAVLADYVDAFAQTPLSFPCGRAFQYSLSHDLLAAVVEKVTGMPFAEYVEKTIFAPLEMESATFRNVTEGMFPMYECDSAKQVYPAPVENELLFSEGYTSGGAGMNCTLADYSKLVMALANGGVAHNGHRLLRPETVRAIAEPLLCHEFVREDFFWQGQDYGYGLGVRVRLRDTQWGLRKGEFGWDGAAGSFWLVDPERKVSIVMGMNILAWENRYMGIHLQLVEQLYRELFAE